MRYMHIGQSLATELVCRANWRLVQRHNCENGELLSALLRNRETWTLIVIQTIKGEYNLRLFSSKGLSAQFLASAEEANEIVRRADKESANMIDIDGHEALPNMCPSEPAITQTKSTNMLSSFRHN